MVTRQRAQGRCGLLRRWLAEGGAEVVDEVPDVGVTKGVRERRHLTALVSLGDETIKRRIRVQRRVQAEVRRSGVEIGRFWAVACTRNAVALDAVLLEQLLAALDGFGGGLHRIALRRVGRSGVGVHPKRQRRRREEDERRSADAGTIGPWPQRTDLAAVEENDGAGKRQQAADHFVPTEDSEWQ